MIVQRYSVYYGKGCEGDVECSIEPYFCENYWCDSGCDCGFTFDEAKEEVLEYYRMKLKRMEGYTEETWENY